LPPQRQQQQQQRGRSGRGQDHPVPPTTARNTHRIASAAPEQTSSRANVPVGRSSRRRALLGLVEAAERSDEGNASVSMRILSLRRTSRDVALNSRVCSRHLSRRSRLFPRAETPVAVLCHPPLHPPPLSKLPKRCLPALPGSRHVLPQLLNPPLPPKKLWKMRGQRGPGADRGQRYA
jgi:hypothetical protein